MEMYLWLTHFIVSPNVEWDPINFENSALAFGVMCMSVHDKGKSRKHSFIKWYLEIVCKNKRWKTNITNNSK